MNDTAAPLTVALERPNRREHMLINFTTADGFRYTAGLGYFDHGRLAEVFLNSKIWTGLHACQRLAKAGIRLVRCCTDAGRRAVHRIIDVCRNIAKPLRRSGAT